MFKKNRFKKILISLFISIFFLMLFSNLYIYFAYKSKYVNSIEALPDEKRVVVVLGAGMVDNENMTKMQEDRVKQAVRLYKKGKADKILMSGDDGTKKANEVSAMKKMAQKMGVREGDIIIDGQAFNTFLSCDHLAKSPFNYQKIYLITQKFHLPRAIYFCQFKNIDTIGLSADLHKFNWQEKLWLSGLREYLARTKAIFMILVDLFVNGF